jgi:lipid-A-disaccharide synthase
MKWYIIAGESSGDLHGSNLIRGILQEKPHAKIRFWGGQKMAEATGSQPVVPLEKLSFMGFSEVVMHLPQILSNIRKCKGDIKSWNPDVIVFIDFPGFNLRIAKWAHQHGFPIHYYIAPQAWAWKKARIKKMRKFIDHLFVILPFEEAFFLSEGMSSVHYEGHPLMDVVTPSNILKQPQKNSQIALLPGSRQQEIAKMLPIMCEVAQCRPTQTFRIAGVDHIDRSFYQRIIQQSGATNVTVAFTGTKNLLPQCQAAIVTSGTATLETALFGIPQIVVYSSSRLSYEIARRLIQVPYISLVNLILDREAVPELIQTECNATRIDHFLSKIETDESYRRQFQGDYEDLQNKLGNKGVSRRIARRMIEQL